jgi:hypothetical protein
LLSGGDDAIAARPLGREKRLVGVRDNIFRTKPGADSSANGCGSDADGKYRAVDAGKCGVLNRFAGPFADCGCLVLVGVGKDGTKLFASVTGNRVDPYADTVLEHLCDLFETEVAALVTDCVVYFLEAINVDHEQANPAALAECDFAQPDQRCIEIPPIE